MHKALFDTWTERYDSWFTTPTGQWVYHYERALLLEMLEPAAKDRILDVGCGTGLFTREILSHGAAVVGVDLSEAMLRLAVHRCEGQTFAGLCANMEMLPFADASFDKVVSMTAIEFVADAGQAMAEFNRVVRPGGLVVVTTLNSLSPWAEQRLEKGRQGHSLFTSVRFRSPQEMAGLAPAPCRTKTAVHFLKQDSEAEIVAKEADGQARSAATGAMAAICWQRP